MEPTNWQTKISGLHRTAPEKTKASKRCHDAAVFMPVLEHEGKLCLLFEVRSADIIQGGEICFPGGRIEENETAEIAAVRETTEELCVSKEQVKVYCPMHTMGAPGGGTVTSFLGTITDYHDTFGKDEVDHMIYVPLQFFADHEPVTSDAQMEVHVPADFPYALIPGGKDYPFRRVPRRFYFYETDQGVIWGMTAELVFNLVETLKEEGN